MKLKKDEFKRGEIEVAGKKIIGFLIDYVRINKLYFSTNNYSSSHISLNDENFNVSYNFMNSYSNFKKVMETNFKFLNENNAFSHSFSIPYAHKVAFYSNALKQLNQFEKIVLIKSMFEFRPSFKDINPEKGIISEEDFWLHLRHIAPFSKIRQKQHSEDVRTILDSLHDKSIDTKEKVDSLAYFLNYYKPISKRTDIKAGLTRLLKSKVDESYFPIFEAILGDKIKQDNIEIDFFSPSPEVETIIITKEALFEQISFSRLPQAQTHHYNKYLQLLNSFLLSSDVKKELNIARVDFYELSATKAKEPARIYISSEEDGFKGQVNIKQLYRHLIQSCTDSFQTTNLDSAFKTSFEYFLLNKSINEKNSEKEDYSHKRKTIKI